MRVARLYAQTNAPERPRVADPQRRRRIADYLSGGTAIGRGAAALHTDGVWLWPERFAAEALDAGLAPEPDLLDWMHTHAYRPAAPEPGERLTSEALRAWRDGPPEIPRQLVTYFVRVDAVTTPQRPLSLLRRTVTPTGGVTDEAVWRDLGWHPTNAFVSLRIDDELREVASAEAAAVLDLWCDAWHAEAIARTAIS